VSQSATDDRLSGAWGACEENVPPGFETQLGGQGVVLERPFRSRQSTGSAFSLRAGFAQYRSEGRIEQIPPRIIVMVDHAGDCPK